MYNIKTKGIYENFSDDEEMFDFGNYSKCYDGSNKLVVGMIKDETSSVAVKYLVELKPKMYSLLVDDSSEW